MHKLPLSQLESLLAHLARERTVYAPAEQGGQVNFAPWAPGTPVQLDTLNTALSPKGLFFPQSEDLMAFKLQGKSIDILDTREEAAPFVLFGVRPCDASAMEILDRIFLADPVDSYYAARRQQGVMITRACLAPEDTCFCPAMGVDALRPVGDVVTWTVGDTLYWRSQTGKGEALTQSVAGLLQAADEAELVPALDAAQAEFDSLPLHGLSLEGFDGDATERLFDRPEWRTLSQSCLGCGSCTFLCPTCQCYDIRDYDTGHGIRRFRCWDSCMYSDFTKMAHGNPRTTQVERFRQRFMHKLVYFPANHNGQYACVGCGRCVAKCPVSMNIVKVIKTLGVKGNG